MRSLAKHPAFFVAFANNILLLVEGIPYGCEVKPSWRRPVVGGENLLGGAGLHRPLAPSLKKNLYARPTNRGSRSAACSRTTPLSLAAASL
jgi:hypothetical protein